MIYGIGIDVVELARIKEIHARKGNSFLKRILTDGEIEKIPQKRMSEYIAGRFAAKEATAKALGTGIGKVLSWRDIEILNESNGRPIIRITNKKWNEKQLKIHISISHTSELAIAKVIIEQ